MRSQASRATATPSAPGGRLFSALRQRNFRALWFASTAASLAQRMDSVVLGWLVLELTNSAFLVGLLGSMRFLGALLGPVTGVVADRCDRRRLLLTSLLAMSGVVVILLMLVMLRRLAVWHLLLATTVWGMLWAIHQPAQQSLQADIHSGRELVNGIALLNTAMNLTSIIGPAIGGALLECCGPAAHHDRGTHGSPSALALPEALLRSLNTVEAAHGVQWSYVVLVGLSLFQLWHYRRIRLVQRPPKATQTSIWQNLLAGMRYSRSNPGLWTALVLAGMVNMVAFPLQFGLLPVFARDVFQVGAAGLGLLGAALGLGSLLGSFLMALLGAVQHAGRLMLAGTTGWLVLLMVFSVVPNYTLALGVLVVMGIAQTFSLTNMTVLLLGTASSDMRGRVMGLRSLAVAPLFLGGTLAGAATARLGAPLTTIICAVIGLLIVVWVTPWIPRRTEVQQEG